MAIQRLTITRIDGTEITVTPNLADTLNFESTLRKNPHWGDLKQNALKMQPFRAWSAGKREGTIAESWEDFANAVAEVNAAADDAEELENETDLGLGGLTIQPMS